MRASSLFAFIACASAAAVGAMPADFKSVTPPSCDGTPNLNPNVQYTDDLITANYNYESTSVSVDQVRASR
jgi:hypothetical protein